MRTFLNTAIAALIYALTVTCHAAPETYKVPVEDFSGLDGYQDYVTANLSPELKQVVRERRLAVWAYTAAFELKDANYCFATVGLTHAEKADRNARKPASWYSAFASRNKGAWDASDCQADRLRAALSSLNSATLAEALTGIDSTTSAGGSRITEGRNVKTVHLNSDNLFSEAKDAIFAELQRHGFGGVFDYRDVQTSVVTFTSLFDDGTRICIAVSGLTARNPEGRQPRWPARSTGFIFVQQGGNVDVCKGAAALGAVRALLNKPWTSHGILKDFAFTREDGVPLPDANAVAKKHADFVNQQLTKRASQPETKVSVTTNVPVAVNPNTFMTDNTYHNIVKALAGDGPNMAGLVNKNGKAQDFNFDPGWSPPEASSIAARQESKTDPFPPRPAKKPGVVSCETKCCAGSCFRTYDDGRKVKFEAPQKVNPQTRQLEWELPPC
jgi:hypothetical protein